MLTVVAPVVKCCMIHESTRKQGCRRMHMRARVVLQTWHVHAYSEATTLHRNTVTVFIDAARTHWVWEACLEEILVEKPD
jgi:nitrous oxidase accessory protein NosD